MTESAEATVAVERCDGYEVALVHDAVRRAIEAAGGLDDLVRPGDRVLVKPNLVQARHPALAITTHPLIVEAVVDCLAERGAEIVIADQPTYSLARTARHLMADTGIADIAESYGAATALLSEDGYEQVALEQWLRLPTVHMAHMALDADVVINLPKCKTHMQTLFTGAIKNMFGALAPKQRMDLHALGTLRAVSEAIADLYSACVPELHVMDAVVAMHGTGPARGKPFDVGLVMVSQDGVALDRVATEIMGYREGRVPMIEAAARLGCGEARLEAIEVRGPPIDEVRRRCRLPPTALANIPPGLTQAARRLLYVRPRVARGACRACGACAEVCPGKAIQVRDIAHIDYERCIECFCCQEACRYDAIDVQRSLLARLVT